LRTRKASGEAFCDLGCQVHCEDFKLFCSDGVTDNAQGLKPDNGYWLGGEQHLFEEMDACHFH
jgi:hypothetical protein